MDSLIARKTWRTLEPLHGMIYFAPEAASAYRDAGVTNDRAGYFASRAAPMGAASAELVIATFYNFCPDAVRAGVPDVWNRVSPADLIAARFAAADRALRRLLGDEIIASDEMVEAASLARNAATAASDHVDGRPLFAGHTTLEWPEAPHLVLWHAQALLREYRGDGHIAALVADGVSGIEALIMHGGTGVIPAAALQASREWPDHTWTTAVDRLIDRGLLQPDGKLSDLGAERRQWVEDRTDALALLPYEAIGEEACNRLRELCRPMSKTLMSNGGLPF